MFTANGVFFVPICEVFSVIRGHQRSAEVYRIARNAVNQCGDRTAETEPYIGR